MLKIDPKDQTITCPQGDTGMFTVSLVGKDGLALPQTIIGVAVFSVCQISAGLYKKIKSKHVPLVDNTATILITNEFSRAVPAGTYMWDVRIVTDPEYDLAGDVICSDSTDEVHSLYAARDTGMPKYIVPGVAVNV
ncbi:MAG: hypothetical protein RR337_11545 [Clostridia bacterium]